MKVESINGTGTGITRDTRSDSYSKVHAARYNTKQQVNPSKDNTLRTTTNLNVSDRQDIATSGIALIPNKVVGELEKTNLQNEINVAIAKGVSDDTLNNIIASYGASQYTINTDYTDKNEEAGLYITEEIEIDVPDDEVDTTDQSIDIQILSAKKKVKRKKKVKKEGARENSEKIASHSKVDYDSVVAKQINQEAKKDRDLRSAQDKDNPGTMYHHDSEMDDGGKSKELRTSSVTVINSNKTGVNDDGYHKSINGAGYTGPDDYFVAAEHSANRFKQNDLSLFNNRYRFGYIDPYRTVSTVREYLFFTKPDLNICADPDGNVTTTLAPYLRTKDFWTELYANQYDVIKELQYSLDKSNPFNDLLGNAVISTLEIPGIEAEMIDTPANMYGVSYTYRGSSEASDNNPTFSLEFRDNKYLPVYNFFKAYEDYEVIKHHGHLPPQDIYRQQKILYDQYSIYKIMVGDDGETILYYGKFYGVKSKSLPRDVFSNTDFSNGLSYSIDFGAAFYDDMKPHILVEFNNLYKTAWNNAKYEYDVHNTDLDIPDNRRAKAARVFRVSSSYAKNSNTAGYIYKLKWKGDDRI